MKLNELLEGKWVAKSKDGKERRFKNREDADRWRNSYSKDVTPAKEKPFDWQSYWNEKEQAAAANKPSLSAIWEKFQTAVGDSFPDGDPMDRMSHWMNQNGLTFDDLNAAVKAYADVDVHTYLAQMWQDHAADAEHDAMQGHHGETYGNEWFTRENPWK